MSASMILVQLRVKPTVLTHMAHTSVTVMKTMYLLMERVGVSTSVGKTNTYKNY